MKLSKIGHGNDKDFWVNRWCKSCLCVTPHKRGYEDPCFQLRRPRVRECGSCGHTRPVQYTYYPRGYVPGYSEMEDDWQNKI
jgi:hypothetical protein